MKKDNANTKRLSSTLKELIFFFFVLFVFSACQQNDIDLTGIAGSKAPAFTLTSSEGAQINLFDYNDKVVVLFFFGNESPNSKIVAPSIENTLVKPYANRSDYVVLGLDYWNGSQVMVQEFKNATKLSIPLLMDAGNVATNYNTTYNRIIIIDKNHNIIFSGTQDASKDIAAVKEKLDNLLAK